MRIKSLLITQPEPKDERSPYHDLAEKYNVKVTFRQFITIQPVPAIDFLKERIRILDHTAVIFNSRTAIEHFFRICRETRVEVPAKMNFFCTSEAFALYLQKFTTYRKRKIFYPKTKDKSIKEIILKHKEDRYFIPCSDSNMGDIQTFLEGNSIKYTTAALYRTISADLSNLDIHSFDIIALFSPTAIKALFENFRDFKQDSIRLAAFGENTIKSVREAGLHLDIEAPTPQAPSMKMALEQFIKNFNK